MKAEDVTGVEYGELFILSSFFVSFLFLFRATDYAATVKSKQASK